MAQEILGLTYHRSHDIPVVVGRAFNHIGPGQRDVFVVASFAMQLARISAGAVPPVVQVGNLDAERDFTDVRDVVRAYRLLVMGRATGEPINVATGAAVTIRQILDLLITLSGVEVDIQIDPGRLRRADPPRIVGDATRLHSLTGWAPAIPLERTLRDIWADAKQRVVVND